MSGFSRKRRLQHAFAVLSDPHANRYALEAVCKDIAASRRTYPISQVICLGDLVDYGPHPAEVIAATRELCGDQNIIRGNHDEAVATLNPDLMEDFNAAAQASAFWTRQQLVRQDDGALTFLKNLPYERVQDGLVFVHGTYCHALEKTDYDYTGTEDGNRAYATFTNYASWYYPHIDFVRNVERCFASLKATHRDICFIGHTHQVEGFVQDSKGETAHISELAVPWRPDKPDEIRVTLKPGRWYVINVGSVGQPRDFDPRASWCLVLDYGAEKDVLIRRVPYDIDATSRDLQQSGLEYEVAEHLAARLKRGR